MRQVDWVNEMKKRARDLWPLYKARCSIVQVRYVDFDNPIQVKAKKVELMR